MRRAERARAGSRLWEVRLVKQAFEAPDRATGLERIAAVEEEQALWLRVRPASA